jgi:ligand-binding sensor domain-containing protein
MKLKSINTLMKKIMVLLLFIIGLNTVIIAQTKTSYTVENTGNGLVSNNITCIEIDPKGVIWIGTEKGVSRFDGTNWSTYTTENTNGGLVSNDIYCISFDKQGNTWFGTFSGASKFDGTSWVSYTKKNTNNGLADNKVMSIAIDARGWQWFGLLENGVSVFDGNKWKTFNREKNTIPSKGVLSMALDSLGNVWCGINGVSGFDGKDWSIYRFLSPFGRTYKIVIDKKGRLWCILGSNDYHSRYAAARFDSINADSKIHIYTPETTNNSIDKEVYAIAIDELGNAWFGTDKRVCRFDGVNWKNYLDLDIKSKSFLINYHPLVSIAIDSKNNKWIGTSKGILVIKD